VNSSLFWGTHTVFKEFHYWTITGAKIAQSIQFLCEIWYVHGDEDSYHGLWRQTSEDPVTRPLSGRLGFGSRQGQRFSLQHGVQTSTGFLQPHGQWVPRVKRPEREINNVWRHTSTPLHVFMVWCLMMTRCNFTFTFSGTQGEKSQSSLTHTHTHTDTRKFLL
jgi:hypothetical protein